MFFLKCLQGLGSGHSSHRKQAMCHYFDFSKSLSNGPGTEGMNIYLLCKERVNISHISML